ncbi:MAG: hypothetical protein IPG50_01980 [Myxococcales bacterium]|nr:hypothetical protein [Myxococcales bacterium]
MADATPVFVAAAVVLGLLAVWAVSVAVRPGPKWAAEPPSPAPDAKASAKAAADAPEA